MKSPSQAMFALLLSGLVGACAPKSDRETITVPAPTVSTTTGSATAAAITLTPSSGAPGTPVQIVGTGFDPQPANNRVFFNQISATVFSASTTSLLVLVPPGATSGTVSVQVAGGPLLTAPFTVPGTVAATTPPTSGAPTAGGFPATPTVPVLPTPAGGTAPSTPTPPPNPTPTPIPTPPTPPTIPGLPPVPTPSGFAVSSAVPAFVLAGTHALVSLQGYPSTQVADYTATLNGQPALVVDPQGNQNPNGQLFASNMLMVLVPAGIITAPGNVDLVLSAKGSASAPYALSVVLQTEIISLTPNPISIGLSLAITAKGLGFGGPLPQNNVTGNLTIGFTGGVGQVLATANSIGWSGPMPTIQLTVPPGAQTGAISIHHHARSFTSSQVLTVQ